MTRMQASTTSGAERSEAVPAAQYPFQNGYVTILGHRIHYVAYGFGRPVLFVHGNPTSSYMWREVLPHVATRTGRRGIALDLLGFGGSDKPDGVRYSLDLHARIISGFVDALGLENIVLVADDWGGPLAVRDVVQRQELYEAAILFETFLWTFTFRDDFEPKFRMPFRLMRGPFGFVAVQIFNPLHGKPRASVEFIESIRARLPQLRIPVTWLKATPGVVPSDDYPPSLRRLERLQELLPGMAIKQFGPGHHFLAEENPARLTELIVESIQEGPRRTAAGRA